MSAESGNVGLVGGAVSVASAGRDRKQERIEQASRRLEDGDSESQARRPFW